jgi:type IV pilus assembly protein PilX
MHNSTHSPGGRKQRGWVLVIGLVVLVMLSIIAIALMRTSLFEEKMVGANRDINLSFEAAETALRAVEIFLKNQPNDRLFNATGAGFYAEGAESANTEPDPFKNAWTDATSVSLSSLPDWNQPTGVTSAPRYMIKKIRETTSGAIDISGYGETDLTTKTVVFRITVRGTGGKDNTVTILRSHYATTY